MQTTSDAEDERRPTAVGMFDVMTLAGDIGGGQASDTSLLPHTGVCHKVLVREELKISRIQRKSRPRPGVQGTSLRAGGKRRKREKTSPDEDYMFHTLTLLEMDLVKFVSSPQNLTQHVNRRAFPGGAVDRNLPANAEDMDLIPGSGLGRFHMSQSNKACAPQPWSPCSRAHVLQLLKLACHNKISHHNEKSKHHNKE
ncbi:hypothetical protein JEQ12_020491 [Ovis aries]|uniref:Uncharacterized protein n=1 Tax=Ovis aries TaxID=9940 RepID=A0A835ZI40_SHEEP|nr:hypothetical protein JEQ12_020491 [Ovis aries]